MFFLGEVKKHEGNDKEFWVWVEWNDAEEKKNEKAQLIFIFANYFKRNLCLIFKCQFFYRIFRNRSR